MTFRRFAVSLIAVFVLAFAVGCSMVAEGDVERATFSVDGNTMTMNGTITSNITEDLKKAFEQNPSVDTFVMGNVPGSIDDESNLEAAKWIAAKKLTFVLNADSEIASGGTDFFLAGHKRIIHKGAKVGVHAWGGDFGKDATSYPRGHEEHQRYIDYYQQIGWNLKDSEDFYYFTIYAASAKDIHWMSDAELVQYNIATEPLK